MSTVITEGGLRRSKSREQVSVAGKQALPIVWWSGVGALFMLLAVYVWGSWILSPEFKPTPAPANDGGWALWIKSFEVFCIVASSSTYLWFVVRPLIRERRLNTTGMVIAVSPFLYLQDPFGLYVTQWWTYSSHFTNYGNWISQVPGAITPNAHLVPEPIFAASSMYVWLVGIPFLLIAAGMRKYKARYPQASTAQVFLFGILLGFIYDLVVEGLAVQVGLWSFTGAIWSMSLFGGHWNQFPLYEMVFWGGMAGVAANVLYWTNDKGQVFVERGVERLRVPPLAKGVMRYLAFLGIFQTLILVLYTLPIQFFAMNGDPMPADTPAHLRPGVCGDGTAYACAGPGVPLNRAGPRIDGQPAVIISPDMSVVTVTND